MLPSEVEQMPASDYAMLEKYWLHEPWGAWRDNLHTAILAGAVLQPNMKKGAKLSLDSFMVQHPDDLAAARETKRKRAARSIFEAFKSIATKGPSNG